MCCSLPRCALIALLTSIAAGCSGGAEPSRQTDAELNCEAPPGYHEEVSARRIGSVSATVVDTNGAPASDLLVQICGLDLCISGNTQPSGSAVLSVQQDIKEPAFKYGSGVEFAQLAFHLPSTADSELGLVTAIKLPDLSAGAELTRGQSASSGDVTLELAGNATIHFDELVYPEREQQKFRVARILPEHHLAAIDETLGLELLFAAAPVETEFCPPAKLRVINSLGWAGGTEVEIFVHGVDIEERWAPYAGWAKVSDGVVSADGAFIETPNGGLPVLSTFGIRKKP